MRSYKAPSINSIITTATLLATLLLIGCASHPPFSQQPDYVDADRFMGEWYSISNIPYFAERGKVATKTTYIRRGPNQYDDIFESRNKNFSAPVKKLTGTMKSINANNTEWQSTFYKVISSKFSVLYIDDNYQTVLLGHKSRKYGWVFSRNTVMSDNDYAKALAVFKANGFDTNKFKKVPQREQQLGLAGFQGAEK